MADETKLVTEKGAICNINGVSYTIPEDTEIKMAMGNKLGKVITSHEVNGDGTTTPIMSRTVAYFDGLVVRFDTADKRQSFQELCGLTAIQVVIMNAGYSYTISTGFIEAGADNATPEYSLQTGKSESFKVISSNGQPIVPIKIN